MALSDCVKCWNTPCTCGWGFKTKNPEQMALLVCYWPKSRVARLIELLQMTLEFKLDGAIHDPEIKE